MSLDRMIFVLAGLFIVLSVLLSVIHSPWWLLFTAFVGLNMIQAAFTGFCPMVLLLKKAGIKPGEAFH